MATLQVGEKARMYALGKIARGGATRGGYVSAKAFISIDGVHVGFGRPLGQPHTGALIDSFTIDDMLNEAANTCQFRVTGMVPTAGAQVVVTLGSKNSGTPLFAGMALHVVQGYAADRPANVIADVNCVDYTWLFAFLKVTENYSNQSATAIALDLVAKYAAANGFTTYHVAPYLPTLSTISFTETELDQALSQLATRIGGYWYVDYLKDLHLFLDETGNGTPEVLTPQHRSLAHVTKTADRTQVLTRVYVEGGGASLLGAVGVGDTKLPVDAAVMFAAAADVFAKITGSTGTAQLVNFTGTVVGGAGSLVGPGVGPPGAMTLGRAAGSGLSVGRYQYAYTDVTPTGETLPSPLATIDVGGPIQGPTDAPGATPMAAASGVDLGTHNYSCTYITGAGGETLGGGVATVNTQGPLTPSGGINGFGPMQGGSLTPNYYYQYAVTYVGNGGGETTQAVAAASVNPGLNTAVRLGIGGSTNGGIYLIPAGVTQIKIYRSNGQPSSAAAPLFYIGSVAYGGSGAVTFDDYGYLGGAPIPTTNTAVARMQKVHVTTTASPDPAITGVRIYRTKVSGSGWWLVAQVTGPQGAVAYDDVIADANLGAAASFIDTSAAGYLAVAMSNIAPGPSPTTARRVYRTKVNATQLYLWGTVADNVTTAYTDVLADSNLSIVAPTSDTSGLQQVAGQVTTGATTMVVANVGPFEPTGGWAVIGNGEQVIRYTGKTGNTLVGIPPTGIGAIVAGVAYNSTVTAAPMIVGLPTSGRRALNQALAAGDTINFMVFRDNAARMTDLGTMVKGGPGIREEYIQDRRLAIPEARARGDATLAQRPLEDVTLTYTCRDLRTASGKTITVNLPAPWNIAGTFKIQRVTIAQFRASATQYPTFTVTASTDLFSFDDWLRQIEAKA